MHCSAVKKANHMQNQLPHERERIKIVAAAVVVVASDKQPDTRALRFH